MIRSYSIVACIILLNLTFISPFCPYHPFQCRQSNLKIKSNILRLSSWTSSMPSSSPSPSLLSSIPLPSSMQSPSSSSSSQYAKIITKFVATLCLIPLLSMSSVQADDELAQYAAAGNSVGVDGQCFIRKCSLETAKCANDPTCLKGLSCLARCKGGSMCSTGCFAKYGSDKLDDILYCSVEKNDCVHVPGKENTGWIDDKLTDLPGKPVEGFNIKSLDGTWYKVMGLDSRYDCFDCQRNSFKYKDSKTLDMEALFRIPRPSFPGYLQSKIVEELHATELGTSIAHLRSQGKMFGLTFWENWYVLGDSIRKSNPTPLYGISSALATTGSIPDLKLIYYTGHTLQGSYKGAFVYSRSPTLNDRVVSTAADIIRKAGLDPMDFCTIRNACFLNKKDCSPLPSANADDGKSIQIASNSPSAKLSSFVDSSSSISSSSSSSMITSATKIARTCSVGDFSETEADPSKDAPFWYLGQRFFQVSNNIAKELADWFEDPAILSDWLVSQQEHGLLNKPLAVSPFASLPDDY